MIVVGADTHKDTHTAVAVDAATGLLLGELTAVARRRGFIEHLDWARGLSEGEQVVWAIEDCRHVSGGLERFLVGAGERVVRVPPRMMGQSRRGSRRRGKSDSIDATNVAHAALAEGVENLPCAYLNAEEMEIKLLADHREDLVRSRSDDQQRLRWHLHEIDPDYEIPVGALDRRVWLDRIVRRLSCREQSARVRVSRELVRSIRASVKRTGELEREIAALTAIKAPALFEIPGCGALTAAKIVSETARVEQFCSDAKLARLAGVAPIPVSSGRRDRHRLDRGGTRQLNWGKSRMEAIRCLKRQLARCVWQALRTDAPASSPSLPDFRKLRPAGELALT